MKLNHDCVRDVLIWVEDNVPLGRPRYTDDMIEDLNTKWSQEDLIYSVIQLNEAGLLDGGASQNGSGISLGHIQKLTWKGHEYLDNIRDDKVWKKTKETVFSKIGSASLSVFSSVAAKIIEDKFNL